MEFFDGGKIEKAASVNEWVEAMTKALAAVTDGQFVLPRRMHLDRGNDTFLLMPCISDEYWATKLVSFCPGNRDSGRQSIYGTVVLSSSKTGEPLAVLDGTKITAMRTAAVSAVGIKLLSPPEARALGIIGTGVQGLYQALFACAVRKISEIRVYDKVGNNITQFTEQLQKLYPEIRVINCSNSTDVVLKSEVIITATNSQTPVFREEKDLLTGKTFVGIGSYKPDCREFPEQLFLQISQLFIDTPDGKHESGDLIDPVKNKWLDENNIIPIGELISGNVDLTSNPTRIFKTVGSAIFDLFAAKLVYENSLKK